MYNNNLQTKPRKWEAKPLFTIHYQLLTIRAFTLVELLTVVVIISMLAGMSMLALSGTMTAAKESKTRGTIAKLDAAILDIFEGYQERFDSMSIDEDKLKAAGIDITVTSTLTLEQKNTVRALVKLHFISDIMRMEMPCRWEDVDHNITEPMGGPIPLLNGPNAYHVMTQTPPVLQYYRTAHNSISGMTNTAPQSSELLFLIIANLNPEALENFHGSEIGDIDGNGLREFHDAWGRPIQFIRWAPAFPGSDLQPDVVTKSNYPLSVTTDNTAIWANPLSHTDWNDPSSLSSPEKELVYAMKNASSSYSDPFDPDNNIMRTWFVYPLIVSGGADGLVDLNSEEAVPATLTHISAAAATVITDLQQAILHPVKKAWGMPNDYNPDNGSLHDNSVLNHYDNIHNHRSNNSF